jgi:predicted nucleic acid-binding protein
MTPRASNVGQGGNATPDTKVIAPVVGQVGPLGLLVHNLHSWTKLPVALCHPGAIQGVARELLDHCEVVDLTPEIRLRAIEVRPASGRSLDGIHVATALVRGINRFASFDVRQRIAAGEMGFKLVGASA